MVLKEGVDVESLGKAASLPPDLSPIKMGTSGRFGEAAFTVLGRVRLAWSQGAWNEWFLEFSDGSTGWLAEAQGFFMVSRPMPTQEIPSQAQLEPGCLMRIAGMEMRVVDQKRAKVVGFEGELPFTAKEGESRLSIDLSGPGLAFGNIEIVKNHVSVFAGRYCHFQDLGLQNLRPVPGWFGNPPLSHETGAEALNCPHCSASVEIKAPGQSVTVVCGSCRTVLDVGDKKVAVIAQAMKQLNVTPTIPLGSRGTLFGMELEAIGFMVRGNGPYSWQEYLLFNPHHGYYWLVTYQGHWNFVERLLDTPEETATGASYEGVEYSIFLRGEAQVRYVMGEFYWRVDVREKALTADYTSPPLTLSKEDYPSLKEATWSRGRYIEGTELQAAFGLAANIRQPVGVYLNQPNPYGRERVWPTALLLIALLTIVQLAGIGLARNEVLAEQTFTWNSNTNRTTGMLEFEVNRTQQTLEITSAAELIGPWAELNYELKGIQSGSTASFVEAVEIDKPLKATILPGISRGKYRLLVGPAMDPAVENLTYSVKVRGDVPVWQNYWICLSTLAMYPLFRSGRRQKFEWMRWAESDYTRFGQLIDQTEDDEE